AADERKNVVHVSGPADVVAKAKRFLTEIDTKSKGQSPIAIGEPFLKVYTVSGNAEAIAKTLTSVMKTSGSLTVTAIGTTSIAVWGAPQDHIDVLKQIEGTKTKIENKLFALSVLDAAKTVEMLKEAFPDSKNAKPYLAADTNQSAIIVKGTP